MGCTRTWRATLLSLAIIVTGCSSGGDQPVSAEVTTNNIDFSAASPDAPTPPPQTLSATLGAGTVYVAVLHSGSAIADATYTLTGNVAQIVVSPASPASVGAGIFSGAVTVTPYGCANADCSRFAPGLAQVVRVALRIPPVVRFVAPYAGTTGRSETVIIRGQGFQAFAVENVMFGATPATEFSIVNDTELRATYPLLATGTYNVQIHAPDSPGTILSSANLAIIDAPSYTAGVLAYPSGTPQVQKLLYDAERQALLVAVNDAVEGGKIIRYPSAGGVWGSPTTAAVTGLSDIALSTEGTQLLALSQAAITQTDPVTLSPGNATAAPTLSGGVFLKNLAVTNDGYAVVTTGYGGTADTPLYLYNTRNPGFFQPETTPSLNNATPAGSADGALIALAQGDPTLTTAPSVYAYYSLSSQFSVSSIALNQNSVAPAVDRGATRIVLNGTDVYDSAFVLLGTLPNTTLAVAIKPDATRAYTFDSVSSQILSFDLTAAPAGAAFPQVGTGTALAGNPGARIKMAISADGGTLFLAGSDRIVVQPTPP